MLNRRRQLADVLKPETWLRSRAGQFLSGVGLAASPQFADASRKSERRADDQERKNDDSGNDRDDRDQKNQNERDSDQKNGKAGAEDRDSSGKSEKHDRDENRSENDESRNQDGSDNGKNRGDSRRRDDDSDSSARDASSADADSSQDGGRRVREFEQQAHESAQDTPAQTTVTPANPNAVDDIPTTSIADLVVEANEDVVATVSTSGGFAFARSGDVIAVTGPDGATIIQTGDVTTGTNGTDPVEPPADGGNNDLDFAS